MRVTAIFLNMTQNHCRILQAHSYSQKKPDVLDVCYWILKHIQNLVVNSSSVQATQGQYCKGAQWSQLRPSGIKMLWGMWEVSVPTKSCVCVESDGCEAVFVHECVSTNTHRCPSAGTRKAVHREKQRQRNFYSTSGLTVTVQVRYTVKILHTVINYLA